MHPALHRLLLDIYCEFALFLNLHQSPFLVWMVAPVTSSTESGEPLNSTSNFWSNIPKAIVDSINANWSPTHFLGPPPNGKNAKSDTIWYLQIHDESNTVLQKKRTRVYTKNLSHVTSLGYKAPRLRDGSKPAHPSIPSLFFLTKNLSGSNSSGLSQKKGDLWRLYTYNVNFKRVSPHLRIFLDRIFSYTTQLAYMSSLA